VKAVASKGKLTGIPVPASRAISASLGTLSIDGNEGVEGAGTPN
jgi:hypothetical protein